MQGSESKDKTRGKRYSGGSGAEAETATGSGGGLLSSPIASTAANDILPEDHDLPMESSWSPMHESSDDEGEDDDNASSCCSDSADSKEWITLRPDDENLDSSKIAALSSAFSNYISSPKHTKSKQKSTLQDDEDPSIGQFLLPLVTEQLPGEELISSVETDHSVIEVLAAEAEKFKKSGDMSALAWRILGEYHALENSSTTCSNEKDPIPMDEDEDDKLQMMQFISKFINDETLTVFQEFDKEIQGRTEKMEVDESHEELSYQLHDEAVLSNMKKFSDTQLVKNVLQCISGEKTDIANFSIESVQVAAEASDKDKSENPPSKGKSLSPDDGNKSFKFLENSPLRSTLEQYMMMQIASREAEAEQNQRLLRELGGITNISSCTEVSSNGTCVPEEPIQRIFDCDSVNTTSRFIELDDCVDGANADKSLCPGGCGNLTPCSRYTNNGADFSNYGKDQGVQEDERDEDSGEKEKPISEEVEIGRLVDAQSGWWELRSLLCALWRAADVGGLTCKSVAIAMAPPCHCCRCSHPTLRQLPQADDGAPCTSCQCQQQSAQHPNQPRERCRSCVTYETERLMKQVWGTKLDMKVPPVCCCQARLRSTRTHHSCVVRLFFKDPAVAPIDFDLSKTEFVKHDLEVNEEDSKFLKECHQRYLDGVDDIPSGDEDVISLCARCKCKCGRVKFYCPKARDRAIKKNIDNFTRLAPQLLILRLDALCSALCAWHGAHLSRILAGGAVMTFLKELWRRAAAMRNGGIALSGILGPTRRRLATVCGRLLAPHQYLSSVYRAWADRAAATRVVHLSMLQLLGKSPPQTVEALQSFSSLQSMMNEAETLRNDVTTFLGNYRQCERDEFLTSLRLRLMLAQRKNLAIAQCLGLLGDDPCELKGDKDCESSVVAGSLSECLPTDPAELDEFERIVQAMLLYHPSGGGVNQIPIRANRILSSDVSGRRENSDSKKCSNAIAHAEQNINSDMLSSECSNKANVRSAVDVSGKDNIVVFKNSINSTNVNSGNTADSTPHHKCGDSENKIINGRGDCAHSSAIMKRRQQLENEFVKKEKCRIMNFFHNSFVLNPGNSSILNETRTSASLLEELRTSSESSSNNRPRPMKRKFKTETAEGTENASTDIHASPATNGVTFRMKSGCLKAGLKPNRISKAVKGRYVKSIRRASIGHTAEVVKKELNPTSTAITNSPKIVHGLARRGRSASLYSQTRNCLKPSLEECESLFPMNSLSVSESGNVLRWYSMPDILYKDSHSDSDCNSAADVLTCVKLGEGQMQAKEFDTNLKGLTSKLIPQLFVPPPSSVDPVINISFKKDSCVKDKDSTSETKVFNDNEFEKLRKPVFDIETPEQRYLRMQLCECLEKMELLGLENKGQQSRSCASVDDDDDDDDDDDGEVPSPPLELSPTLENPSQVVNVSLSNKHRIISLSKSLVAGEAADNNGLSISSDIMAQEKNILRNFIDYEIGSKKDVGVSLNDIKLVERLSLPEITNSLLIEKQTKDSCNVKASLASNGHTQEANEIDMGQCKDSKHLNDIMKEHEIEPETIKRLLDPLNYVRVCGTKNVFALSDDLSLLTPETIKQLKEVRQAKIKKQMCGKRKNSKKQSECLSSSPMNFPDQTRMQSIVIEDPTKEEIMIEMLGHRHRRKGFKNAKEFEIRLYNASLQVVMRKVLQTLMPCEEDIELDNLKKCGKFGSPYDVKVGSEVDGFNIDDYWDGIRVHFSSWRASTLEQYCNLPRQYLVEDTKKERQEPSKSVGTSQKGWENESMKYKTFSESSTTSILSDEQKKQTLKKTLASKIIALDPDKAKSYLTPAEHALFVERLQAVNKDYVDKLLKQSLTGEDWVFAMNELQNLERKLKSTMIGKSSNSSSNSNGSNKTCQETREAELLAGRGLSKLINQFSKKTKESKQDLNAKTPSSKPTSTTDGKIDKSKPSIDVTVAPNQAVKTDGSNAMEIQFEDDPTMDKSQPLKTDAASKCKEDVKKPIVVENQDKVKAILVSGKARPVVMPQSDGITCATKTNCKNDSQPCSDCPVCTEHMAQVHGCNTTSISDHHHCECCHQCSSGQSIKHLETTDKKQKCKHQIEGKKFENGTKTDGKNIDAVAGAEICKKLEDFLSANQRDSETCANHNAADGTNRCSQHSASSRGASGNNSSSNSGNNNTNANDQPCNCCYCTVFGHAPPVTTPVNKSFNETRERLRSILNRKKQGCRPGSLSQGGDSDDLKPGGKVEETPSIIPVTPTVKPDPLPISAIPKHKMNQPTNTAAQSDVKLYSYSQLKQQQNLTNTTTPPTPVKVSTQCQQQSVKPSDGSSQKPNLPLKLKLKQQDGEIVMQDVIREDLDNQKNACRDSSKNDVTKNPQCVAAVKKEIELPPKDPIKNVKDSMNEAIKRHSSLSDVADKKPVTITAVKQDKPKPVQKQSETDSAKSTPAPAVNTVTKNQETPTEEQIAKNNKKPKQPQVLEESRGIQMDKPRSQSLQLDSNPTIPVTKPGSQTQLQVKKGEQNRAKGSGTARNTEAHNQASNTASRDCSVFSTSTVCSGYSVDPRDVDMLMEFIEGPGSVMDKIKKKAKKARQKAKKVVEKLEAKLSKFEVKAAQLRAESNKLDKLLVATVGKKKKPTKKGKKKGDSEPEDESVVALRRTAREYRERVAQTEKEMEDGKRMLNRVAKALLLIGSNEDISQLPEVLAVQKQVSIMSSLEKEELEAPSLLPHHLQELKQMAINNSKQSQQSRQAQNTAGNNNSQSPSLDQILATSLQGQVDKVASEKSSSQCMVTIKRVMQPETGEPRVTITPKGSDKPIYTFQNYSTPISQQLQQQQVQLNSNSHPQESAASKRKSQSLSWESTLAQINALSQVKKKENTTKPKTESKSDKQNTNDDGEPKTSRDSSLHPSRSVSTVSEVSSVDVNATLSKKQRKLLTRKLKEEEEEREKLRLEEEKLAAQKGGNKRNNKGGKRAQGALEEDTDPEKIVLSMRQLKTAMERALEAMDSDGQKLQGKGKLKDNAKEFIEKVVSKVEETKKASIAKSNPSGKRVDKVVDISEVVLGSFSGKMASAAAKHCQQAEPPNKQKQNNNQQQNVSKGANKKQKQREAGSSDGPKVVAGKANGALNANKKNNGKKMQIQNQTVTSVHHRTPSSDVHNNRVPVQYQGNNNLLSNAGYGYQHAQYPTVGQQNHKQLNSNYMDKINLNSDITIQLADDNQAHPCNQSPNNLNTKPAGPISCSIVEQLRNGVQVPDLKLPPGITLTWVDPNRKQPDQTPKSAIPVVKLSSVAPEYRPTPPVVNPPPLIMVDTKNIPQQKDSRTQISQSSQAAAQQQDLSKSNKSKKSKKKTKKPPANLLQTSETSTHSHPRVEDQSKMVTLRNPMFHPTLPSVSLSSVQSGKRVSENIRIPDPIPMPPSACQATITPTSNGMFTIRNPLMSMVHQQNMMVMKDAPVPSSNTPVVLMSSTGSVLTADSINHMKDHGVNVDLAGRVADINLKSNSNQQIASHKPHQNKEDNSKITNSDFITQNLSFTPSKDNNVYSLFKSEDGNVPSPSSSAIVTSRGQENNACPSPIGSKTNRTPSIPMHAARQLDFNSSKQPVGNMSGWHDGHMPVGTQSRKCEDLSSDSGLDGCPPGFYTPFGQAESDKLFGSLLFQNQPREDHVLQQTMWSALNPNEEQIMRNQTHYPKMELGPGNVEMATVANVDGRDASQPMNNGGNRGEYRSQPGVGYGGKNTSIWNGPYSNYQPEFAQSSPSTAYYQQTVAGNYGQNFQPPVNQNYSQMRSSHSSSSSGLMTGSVISSGTNSVYDSVSNSSSASPADASTNIESTVDVTNITNLQQSSPEGRNYGDFPPYVSIPQSINTSNNFNPLPQVADNVAAAERMAEMLNSNRDKLNEHNWYGIGNKVNPGRSVSEAFNHLRLSEEQNYISQLGLSADFSADLAYYNAQRLQSAATMNNFSPTGNNASLPRQTVPDTLHLSDEGKYGSYGVIGSVKQDSILNVDESQAVKNLGAIGSHRSATATNGLKHDDFYPGDSRSIFAPNQTIGDLNELESAERDIESFKRFHFYFEPPKNKPKITLNLKDIKTKDGKM